MNYEWIETTPSVYRAIYASHKDELSVFESYTDNDNNYKLRAQTTAWGFEKASHPIIKSQLREYAEWKYYLLLNAVAE